MLVSCFSPNIPRKNPVEILCKILEMELKTYTLKFVFEKIKFEVLHFIQHDFIRQRLGLSKDQISMFKSLVINYFILKYRHILMVIQKMTNISFFIEVGAANVLLKLNYL